MKVIWCIFGIENNYDQPSHDLVAWWSFEPDFHKIKSVLSGGSDADCGKISRGEEVRIGNTNYRVEKCKEGSI